MRAILLLPSLLLAGACQSQAASAPEPAGVSGTRDFALSGFNAISLRGADDVQVRVGPAFSIRAEGDRALLDKLEIEVDGDTLKVGRKREAWGGWTGPVARISVTLPALREASIAGSGDMTVDAVSGDSFDGSIAGSGNLSIGRLTGRTAEFSIAGSGNLSVAGQVDRVDMSIAGSGNIDAVGLQARDIEANIAGAGDIRAAASNSAEVSIIGAGDVTIRGNPRCEVSKVGPGRVTCGG